jgi:glycosyltransferase involved in cell wall biosynthesis
MDALVGVVIPTYNRLDETLRAVNSVLDQTVKGLRIVVVDDGSDDSVLSKLRTALISLGVELLEISHTGNPSKVRNIGTKVIKNQYVAFLDSDDFWRSDKIEKQLTSILNSECQAICSNAKILDRSELSLPYQEFKKKRINFNSLIKSNKVICSSVLIDRKLFLKCGGFPEAKAVQGAEDYAAWLRIAQFTDWLYIDEPLVTYSREPIQHFSHESGSFPEIQAYTDFIQWKQSNSNKKSFKFRIILKLFKLSLFRWFA